MPRESNRPVLQVSKWSTAEMRTAMGGNAAILLGASATDPGKPGRDADKAFRGTIDGREGGRARKQYYRNHRPLAKVAQSREFGNEPCRQDGRQRRARRHDAYVVEMPGCDRLGH